MSPVQDSAATSSPLIFQGRLTITDVVQIQRYRDLLILRRSVRRLATLFFTLLSALLLFAILKDGPQFVTVVFLSVFVCLLIIPWEREWLARRYYRNHESEYLETRVVLTPDRVAFENSACRSDFEWKLVGQLADTPHGLLFLNQANEALFWLPNRVFEGNDLRTQVLDLAKHNDTLVRRVS